MSPMGPLGDPSFVTREVNRHVSEMDLHAAHKELLHQAREGHVQAPAWSRPRELIVEFVATAIRRIRGSITFAGRVARRLTDEASGVGPTT